mmetsp:Transcript_9672/g.21808  ORF Transcript_9672/g.21808 Transcript_9672/m.21808 type:complete len:879 (-) Transcript_9672:95-2731(-)|eukprot:CAMPEP_0172301336 /NCGR_PEP_ID=MMETSP1058-20130122/3246_1 /TAXON_ID=83371 /ORGANISM="Detonula confervacea, Strain CCMP 353" /LENGTH=878 /DNA_ID=CAMNT_0013011405 /DNA_START=68 /DNA_END=2704 /DNA_ORIENTATION=+
MVKATKRSRKFNAKTGGAAKALSTKGTSLTKKGKTKRKTVNAKGQNDKDLEVNDGKEERERVRASNDFLNEDNLGTLDMDSFFQKAAVGLANDDESIGSDDDDDDDVSKDGDDDDESVDSYTSLGSEEEDVEASELRMKQQLEKLSQKDPEFHKYLAENESSLLEFDDDLEDDDEEDGEDYVQDEDAMESMAKDVDGDDDVEMGDAAMKKTFQKQQKAAENKFLLTPDRQEQLEQGAFASHSIKGLKRIISAYRTACHLSDANQQDNEEASDDENEGVRKKKEFQIQSPVVFDRLMAVCLVQCHEEFHYHLLAEKKSDDMDEESSNIGSDEEKEEQSIDENKPLHPKTLSKSPNWLSLRPLIESFLKSTLHILSEAGKEAKLLQFTLSALSKYIPYLTAFPKLGKPFLKTTVQLWSAPLDTSEDYNAVRLQAFLRIRQLAITQPYPFIEETLKLTYLSYAKRSKFGTAANVTSVLPTLTFMGNCVVELYTLDYASAYQHAFVYVRQLALHLRSAYMKQTPESKSVVCCWQYVHCLKLWTAVLCAACGGNKTGQQDASSSKLGGGVGKDEEANLLRSLVYPLTEIIMGLCRLVPVAQFVPLRLHCVRLLQQLASSTETYIPTTSLLIGVLDLKEVGMKPLRDGGKGKGKKKNKLANVRGLRLPLILKLPKEGTLRTMEQLDNVLKEVFVLLNREVDLYRYSPGFPEFTYAISQRLRKFNKEISNGRWRAYSKGSMELCEKYSAFAINGRSTLADAPKDVRRLEALKPTNIPSMRERYDSAVAKEKRLEAATQPVMKQSYKDAVAAKKKDAKAKAKRKKNGEDDSDDSDVEAKEEEEKKTKPRKKKKPKVVNQADLKNVEALKEEDEVQEGVAWSDSESD